MKILIKEIEIFIYYINIKSKLIYDPTFKNINLYLILGFI